MANQFDAGSLDDMEVAKTIRDIGNFHRKFGLGYEGGPRHLPHDLQMFRNKFLKEELEEYFRACESRDLPEQLDALVDLVYVALGTAYYHGFNFDEAWRRVHEANMKKVRVARPEDSKRGSGYDVVKPPGWQAPNLADLCKDPGHHD